MALTTFMLQYFTGILKHKSGSVLKPLQKGPLGSSEVNFYRYVFDEEYDGLVPVNEESRRKLKKLVPIYYGLSKIQDTTGAWKEYLGLQDIIDGFTHPCVMDIKIGAQTWDPNATKEKILHEKSKYIGTKEPLGLSLTGMQYYNLSLQQDKRMDKNFGKTIVKSSFIEAIETFCNRAYSDKVCVCVATKLLERLRDVQEYFNYQRDFYFYSSSLLVAYDAGVFEKTCEGNQCDNSCNKSSGSGRNGVSKIEGSGDNQESKNCFKSSFDKLRKDDDDSWLRVWMIDFAHVFPNKDRQTLDENYIFGLNNLVHIVNAIASSSSGSIKSNCTD